MSNTIEVFQVDAFTTTPFYGNPAGVVLNAEGLPRDLRQKIARELNCSETAFVTQKGTSQFQFRYFTPQTEVDLCGHATVAALHILRERTNLSGALEVDTNVGLLPMRVESDGIAWMRQANPAFREVDEDAKEQVLDALHVREDEIDGNLPFHLAFTGLWDIMVPFPNRDIINSLKPNFEALATVSKRLGAASVHVYALDPVDPASTLHTRDFSPAVGIDEDPHTGTANGALGALLVHTGVLKPGSYTFEQGFHIGRPGHIQVQVTEGLEVSVGGRAVTVLSGDLRLTSTND